MVVDQSLHRSHHASVVYDDSVRRHSVHQCGLLLFCSGGKSGVLTQRNPPHFFNPGQKQVKLYHSVMICCLPVLFGLQL